MWLPFLSTLWLSHSEPRTAPRKPAAVRLSVELLEGRLVPSQLTGIVAFGDSTVDAGNFALADGGTFPVSPPYLGGRFSNGPMWVERLAADLGMPALTPSLAGGTDYAFGAAYTRLDGLSDAGTPNIGTQISSYLGTHQQFQANQLIVMAGGANDLLAGAKPSVPASNLEQEITAMAQAGGRTFLVANGYPLGDTPQARSQGADAMHALNVATAQLNQRLAVAEDRLERSLGITIIGLDVAGFVSAATDHPAEFGLQNATGQALDAPFGQSGLVVPNPDQYLWWDQLHMTAAANRMVGALAAAAVVQRCAPQDSCTPAALDTNLGQDALQAITLLSLASTSGDEASAPLTP
jgi:phospholipase/lecithinase/hemolysin